MGKTVRRKRKSRIKKRKTRVKKRRSRIKKRKAHFKRRRTRVKKRKFINKKTRRKKRRTIQKGGLGFKDLFIALTAITASLSEVGAAPMSERTQKAVALVQDPGTVFCNDRLHDKDDMSSTTIGSWRRSLMSSIHPDDLKRGERMSREKLTDEEREKRDKEAAIHITNLASIAGNLQGKKGCSTLDKAVGRAGMQQIKEATNFIKKQHGVEDGDERSTENESDNDGNKSSDDGNKSDNDGKPPTSSLLRPAGLTGALVVTAASMARDLRGRDREKDERPTRERPPRDKTPPRKGR
ncbi:hypothetical protein N9P79_00755 [Crocinitomicaceae bacterium]|nr:hypothetical protein [Crocinitomicaceae bacterium]